MHFLKSIKSEKKLDSITEPIAKNLANGDIIFLEGALASGKTTCIREIIKSVSLIKKKSFSFQGSPTYQKANTYDFKNLNILHFDFYNLKQNDQNDLEDYIVDNSILMEWPS
ncbi:tRNA (adenosine(37)-N6)-threonylcarbamoyltransferase complex ATPase subunit type 1 TsaE, partial [Alphaproteobacteria bacterium]|nr:tRNA (adenosine(37)-N6)-threonylcarbamoyltransferase complex ATPase subunit type 1 TsaE [Alphaproteobacteria bacterium]